MPYPCAYCPIIVTHMYIHGDIQMQMNKNMYNFKPLFSIKSLQKLV